MPLACAPPHSVAAAAVVAAGAGGLRKQGEKEDGKKKNQALYLFNHEKKNVYKDNKWMLLGGGDKTFCVNYKI